MLSMVNFYRETNYFKDNFMPNTKMTRTRAIFCMATLLFHVFIKHVQDAHDEVWLQRVCIESVNVWPDLTTRDVEDAGLHVAVNLFE